MWVKIAAMETHNGKDQGFKRKLLEGKQSQTIERGRITNDKLSGGGRKLPQHLQIFEQRIVNCWMDDEINDMIGEDKRKLRKQEEENLQ